MDEEGLVARGHHVAGFLVGAIADLEVCRHLLATVRPPKLNPQGVRSLASWKCLHGLFLDKFADSSKPFAALVEDATTYRWHSSLAFESPPYSIVDTLRLPPAWVDAHESVALVTVKALRAYIRDR